MTARVATPEHRPDDAVSIDGAALTDDRRPEHRVVRTFGTVPVPVTLAAGTHTLKLVFAGDGQNIDWLDSDLHADARDQGTPFKALAIPGTIQAEDYNLGGEGVAYHDTTAGNEGGAYRHDDVDIETVGRHHRTSAGSGTAST